MPFTHTNIEDDLEDIQPLELEQSGLSYQRIPPGYHFPYGHTHVTEEEVSSRSGPPAPPISARIRAKNTSMASATGGLTRRDARQCNGTIDA